MYDVLVYIHENISAPLRIEEVADRFGYSKWHFCKKFHRFTGVTFVEYVRHYRISLAAIDLLCGKKITDIAMNYGYDSVGGFNKAFLKEYGCLAREYKKQAQNAQLYYERRKASMYPLTDRVALLREEAVNTRKYEENYSLARWVYYHLGIAEADSAGLSPFAMSAAGISRVILDSVPFIIPGELIVGYNYASDEFSWSAPSEREIGEEAFRKNGIPSEVVRAFLNLDEKYFTGAYDLGITENRLSDSSFTEAERAASREWAAVGRCIAHNHSVLDYEKVVRLGFSGILSEIEAFERENGEKPIYTAGKKICEAACTLGEKYAERASALLVQGDSAYAAEDLKKIIAVCRRVPKYPARSFTEAVQAIWFAHIINTWEDYINANSLGRLDQILYPYYRADIEKGIMTKEEAFEIICCLWIKLYRDYDVQQSCVGGTTVDGESAVNELSYMMLDATERLDFIRCLSVRFSQKTEPEFLKRALEVVGHMQRGVPFFFNDDVMIPALISAGIRPEDAYRYTQIGCVETVIPGKSNPHAVTGEANLLKAIEYTLANGESMTYPGVKIGEETGALAQFSDYDSFYRAVLCQVDRILDLTCSQVRKHCEGTDVPAPYKSILTEGCLSVGRGFNERGARYDYYQIMLCGIPNLADSLSVIKTFIYREHTYTLQELAEILKQDFPDETVRRAMIKKAPKFGNDIAEVDQIAADLLNHACDTLSRLSEEYGYSFHPQPFTYLWMIDHGRESIATPDGRRRGEPIAYSVSPMQGRDFNGLTAVMNSISKLPTKRTPGTTSAIIEVDPKIFTDRNIDALCALLMASGKTGLSNVQFNTVDADTLIDARTHPEKYPNLAVRVSGFSQKFNLLTPELQDHIIHRTKHRSV